MKIIKQALKFFGISGIGWLMDFSIFTALTMGFGINEVIVNIISSIVAITFVYIVSTKKTFTNKIDSMDLRKKYFIYVFYQAVVILTSSLIIWVLVKVLNSTDVLLISSYAKIFAKIIVTPFTMTINFIFMKILIEKI
jgi:putative flippase GtrA